MANCRHTECRAQIFFMPTEKGKLMPLDAVADPKGRWVLDYQDDGSRYVRRADPMDEQDQLDNHYTSHFETCPFAKGFSRK